MSGVYIPAEVHRAAVTNDYELIAKLLKNESIKHLFTIYVRLNYCGLHVYLDYIVRLARQKVKVLEVQQTLEQKFPADVAIEICEYL